MYKDKKKWETSLGKNPENYETIRNETNIYEQKPVSIDQSNDVEETEVGERVAKRKEKRVYETFPKTATATATPIFFAFPFPFLLPGNIHYEIGGKARRTEKLCFDPGCERNSS